MTSSSHAHAAPTTRMGPVALTVADLARSVDYYRTEIGLSVISVDGETARLGVDGSVLLELVSAPGAVPSRRQTGLFHFALRVPDRTDLARWLAHAARARVHLAGMSDHFVSEAIYLQDPDDHGIEIYWDRPRELWEGRVEEMTTAALDVDDLFGELADPAAEPFDGLPGGTDMGHVHLRVRDIPESVAFYRDVLGFDLMATYGPHAAFLAAGGYHHHIGANVWQSLGAPPAPEGTAALRHATIECPTAADASAMVDRAANAGADVQTHHDGVVVRDPNGINLLVRAR